jgi:aryl-alcohol dehydrogenase-like predicted oxidoreductase
MRRAIADHEIHPIGLGAMPLSLEGRPSEAQAVRTVHAALDAGVTLVDTADAYALDESEFGHNETLVARALAGRRHGIVVATKGGHTRRGAAWELDGRPEYLKKACEASLKRLATDRIDLYQYHRPDPAVPFAESVGALRDLRDEGKIRWIGLSNVTVEQLDEARGIVEIAAVQNELSLRCLDPLRKGEVAACAERGVAFLAWSPLGGIGKAEETSATNRAVGEIAGRHRVSPQRVVLGWLLSLGGTVVPIPGSSRPETIGDSARAPDLDLGEDELGAISAAAGV